MPIKEINAMRRNVLAKLYEKRTAVLKRKVLPYEQNPSVSKVSGLFVKVMTAQQLEAASKYQAEIYAVSSLY